MEPFRVVLFLQCVVWILALQLYLFRWLTYFLIFSSFLIIGVFITGSRRARHNLNEVQLFHWLVQGVCVHPGLRICVIVLQRTCLFSTRLIWFVAQSCECSSRSHSDRTFLNSNRFDVYAFHALQVEQGESERSRGGEFEVTYKHTTSNQPNNSSLVFQVNKWQ